MYRVATHTRVVFALLGLTGIMCMCGAAWSFSRGDVNGDGIVNSLDAAMSLQIGNSSLPNPSNPQRQAADANEDGIVTPADARIILQWAAFGFNGIPAAPISDMILTPVLESSSAILGVEGGEVRLPSGVHLSIPAAKLPGSKEIVLSKTDLSSVDAAGNKIGYEISTDISYADGAALSLPYAAILETGESKDAVEGFAVALFDPLRRKYDIRTAPYSDEGDRATIDLSRLRSGSPFQPEQGTRLLIIVAKAYRSPSHAPAAARPLAVEVEKIIRGVPYYEQGSYDFCWASATVSLLNYYLKPTDKLKPWEMTAVLKIPYEDYGGVSSGLGKMAFYGMGTDIGYHDYIAAVSGARPQTSLWLRLGGLKDYLIYSLDEDRPVVLLIPDPDDGSHVITAVGYRQNGADTTFYVHDPKHKDGCGAVCARPWGYFEGLYSSLGAGWFDSRIETTEFIYTLALPKTVNFPQTASLSTLGHKNPEGLMFRSPMDRMAAFPGGNIRFAWYFNETKREQFLSQDGNGAPVAIPNSYGMQLFLRMANANPGEGTVSIETSVNSNETVNTVFRDEKTERLYGSAVWDSLISYDRLPATVQGSYNLKSQMKNANGTVDFLFLPAVDFTPGMSLTGQMIRSAGQNAVELTWTPYDGDFETYAIYRLDADAPQPAWQPVSLGLDKGLTRLVIPCANTVFTCRDDRTNTYGIAAKRGFVLATSDTAAISPVLTLTSLNGGTFAAGTSQTVTWTYAGNPGTTLSMALYRGSQPVTVIAEDIPLGGEGAGSYTWEIPPALPAGNDYRIRVTGSGIAAIRDDSDSAFTITPVPTLFLTTPNGGETWQPGMAKTIAWTYTEDPGPSVRIELYQGGVNARMLAADVPIGSNGAGSFVWSIPADLVPAEDYRIRITGNANPALTDASDADFAVAASTLSLTYPNGGEAFSPGSSVLIAWAYTGDPGDRVKLELIRGGVLHAVIASDAPSGSAGSGSYGWTIPKDTATGSDYRIRVASLADPGLTDGSDNAFAIATPAAWAKLFNVADYAEQWNSITPTLDGGYVAAGGMEQTYGDVGRLFVLKLGGSGNIEWGKHFSSGGSGSFNDRYQLHAAMQTADGGYILPATHSLDDSLGILKLNNTGAVDWYKTYSGSAIGTVHAMTPVQQHPDGGYLVAFNFRHPDGTLNTGVMKLKNDGDVEWARSYGAETQDGVHFIQWTGDGGSIVVGRTKNVIGTWTTAFASRILKLRPNGDVEWEKALGRGEKNNQVTAIRQTADGGFIAGGKVDGFNAYLPWVVRLNGTGGILWQKSFGMDACSPYDVNNLNCFGRVYAEETIDGGFIASSMCISSDYEDYPKLIKLSGNGDPEWQKKFGWKTGSVTSSIYLHEVHQTADGGYIAAGRTPSNGSVFKLDENGNGPAGSTTFSGVILNNAVTNTELTATDVSGGSTVLYISASPASVTASDLEVNIVSSAP